MIDVNIRQIISILSVIVVETIHMNRTVSFVKSNTRPIASFVNSYIAMLFIPPLVYFIVTFLVVSV